MRYQIEEKDLDALLARRSSYIGSEKIHSIDLINGCIVTITAVVSDYFPSYMPINIAIKTGLFIFGAASILAELKGLWLNKSHNYSVDQMKREIEELNKVQKNYSIVAVKDSFCAHPNRFLQYYDEGWKCWFFLNYPTMNSENEEHITERLRNELGLDSGIALTFKGSWSDDKYSTEHNKWHTYNHELYEAKVQIFPEMEKNDEFFIGGKRYRWMTLAEMAQNPEIQKHNMDVVTRVKEHID